MRKWEKNRKKKRGKSKSYKEKLGLDMDVIFLNKIRIIY